MIAGVGAPRPRSRLEGLAGRAAVGTFRCRHHGILTEGFLQFLRGFEVLHGGVGPVRDAVVPFPLSLAPPLPFELADRLVDELQRDPVFPSGIARGFQNLHRPETRRFVQQIQDAAVHLATGFIGGVEQCTDHDAADGGRGLQRRERNLQKHGQFAAQELVRFERVAGDDRREGGVRQPRRAFVGIGVDPGKCLVHEAHQRAGVVARERTAAVLVNAFQALPHVLFRGRDRRPQRAQRFQCREDGGVPEHVCQQARHHRATARLEEFRSLVLPPAAAGWAVAAHPTHDGQDVRGCERGVDVDPVEHIEARRPAQAELVDRVSHGVARTGQHRPKLTGGVQHHDGAGPCQQCRGGGGGLERPGPGKDQAVGGAGCAGVDEQRGLAAFTPGDLVGRIERHGCDFVHVHAVSFPDDDTAEQERGTGKDFLRL